ncbi:serine/threonine protein kinase [Streptomyces glomeratus]|uniref:non-specific serine/threonine protein kinase n=1 Tax=Streptomyces glomeratus TaxID=284452 RepID=A0ABP6LI37_9ACTN|nr:serine/threonine protein kinase [Streptomyces glomeratus]MCF1510719.1 protein kinase [Streptomyces glomeratus]
MDQGQVSTRELIAGRYRTLEVVHQEEGRTVALAEDLEFGRPVTLVGSRLALLRPEAGARRTVTRILRESEAMQLLCPAGVATVLDAVEDNGVLWTVTERIEGTPLGELLARGPLNYVRAARIGLGILDVLEAAHRRGVTHGDLSPGQVFVREDGSVVVTGFGLIGASVTQRISAPSYAAPEQARGSTAGPEADQWALGALLYAMTEGRPPFKDRGPAEATLRAVDRLPLRSPVNAGPLAPAVTGLLRRDALERVPEPVVRASLMRILNDDVETPAPQTLTPRFGSAWLVAHRAGRVWSSPAVRRSVLAGAVLVVAASSVAVLVTAGRPGGTPSAGAQPSRSGAPSASAAPTGDSADRGTSPPATGGTATPSPSGASGDANGGFNRLVAPEGFSVDLPRGWKRLRTYQAAQDTYRVTFGASGDPRTLTVTEGVRLGQDPVAVWRDLEPSLRSAYGDYARVGTIRAVTYQGYQGADMVWLSTVDGVRVRTFGRGFLTGGGRGFSLRWTTPAADADSAADRQALDVILRSFRPTER